MHTGEDSEASAVPPPPELAGGPGAPAAPAWIVAAPPPRSRMSLVGIGLALLAGAFLGGTCATCASLQAMEEASPFGPSGPRVGVVEVLGPIMDSREVVEQLARFTRDEELKAIVLRVDSPGGTVGPSQEIYEAVRRSAAKKPVVASMGSVAASGGFWVALGADEIFANPGSITGSIGVIVQTPDLTRLAELLRFDLRTYKSGEHKDLGNPLRPSSPGDDAIFQALVDDVYQQFVGLTAERRDLSEDRVRALADGRILSGRDAQEVGLIDGLGGLVVAARRAAQLAVDADTSTSALVEDLPVLVYPPDPPPPLFQLLGASVARSVARGVSEGVEHSLRAIESRSLEVR